MRCGAVWCGSARCSAVRFCIMLRGGAVWCGAAQCGAVENEVLHAVALFGEVRCSVRCGAACGGDAVQKYIMQWEAMR